MSGFLKSTGSRKPIEIAHLEEVCLITSSLQGSPKRSSYGGKEDSSKRRSLLWSFLMLGFSVRSLGFSGSEGPWNRV